MYQQRHELRLQGLSDEQIRSRVAQGRLRRLRHGLYGPPIDGTPEELHLEKVRATMRYLRPGACISHLSAAVVHGLPVPESALARVHIMRAAHQGGGKVRASLHLHRGRADEVMQSEFGPVTGLVQTAVDVARCLPAVHAVALLDVVLRRGIDRGELLDHLEQQRAPGNQSARMAIAFADGRSESVGESHSRWLMEELGLPRPEPQHEFRDGNGYFVARTDFWWEEFGVVGELDGMVKYGRLLRPGQRIDAVVLAEKHREEALRRCGIWVLRWVWADLDDRARFAQLIRRGLELGRVTRS